jgi:uncharacterized membrane protein
MIALGAIVFLPTRWVAIVAVAILTTHNLLDGIHARDLGQWGFVWSFLHEMNEFRPSRYFYVLFQYPVLPWIGVMAAGYSLGGVFQLESGPRRRLLIASGAAMTALFLVLRWSNVYGDSSPWSDQRTALFTLLSFLRTTKYPPSLLFVLMTLGPALIALALIERFRLRPGNPLLVYGGTAMFFYVVHAAVLPLVAMLLIAVQRHEVRFPLADGPPAGAGLPLGGVYLVWVLLVGALYWPCRLFGEYKRAHPGSRWLRYL